MFQKKMFRKFKKNAFYLQ